MTPAHSIAKTEQLFAGIGKIVVRFQQTEMWLAESLAGMLLLRDKTDRHLVLAAMSFRQKVDLMCELYEKRKPKLHTDATLPTIRSALYRAEEFRNRIVHSFWAIECGPTDRWVRIKASLRGRGGFKVITRDADVAALDRCAEALFTICQWMLVSEAELNAAIQVLNNVELPED